jgi:hypothetical protein
LIWVGAAALGMIVAFILNWFIVSRLTEGLPFTRESGFISRILTGVVEGALIGLAQGFLLRQFLPRMALWVWPAATVAGMVISYAVMYVLPITESGFVGIVGAITGCLIPLLVGPFNFLTKSLQDKRIIGAILVFVIGMISFALDRVISPAIEDTITGNEGLYTIAQTIAASYMLAGLVGFGQWLGLRLYLPQVKWWMWVLAAVAGGAFAGIVRGLGRQMLGFELFSFLPNLVLATLATALISAATGFVLVRLLLPAPEFTPQVGSVQAPPA